MNDYKSQDLCFTKEIEGFPGYLICRDGRVISITRRISLNRVGQTGKRKHKGRILKPFIWGCYPAIYLNNNGKKKTKSIHRLIAKAFIHNPENKPEVNHKNGNKLDFRLENLEWCTASENIRHSYNTLKRKPPHLLGKFGKDHHTSKPVAQIKDGKIIKIWECAAQIERELGFNNANISKACYEKHRSCGGFKWKHLP